MSLLVTWQLYSPSPSLGKLCLYFVFKGRHNFNGNIRNGKKTCQNLPRRRGSSDTVKKNFSPWYQKVSRGMSSLQKRVSCYRCKIRHILGESCPVLLGKYIFVEYSWNIPMIYSQKIWKKFSMKFRGIFPNNFQEYYS